MGMPRVGNSRSSFYQVVVTKKKKEGNNSNHYLHKLYLSFVISIR